jgi:hypothetical protein
MPLIEQVEDPKVDEQAEIAEKVEKENKKPASPPTPMSDLDPAAIEKVKAQTAKAVNDEIIKVISNNFLDFRKRITMLFKPEVGVIDDMIVTWQNRYIPSADVVAKAAADVNPAQNNTIKEGKLNVVIYLKTVPDKVTGTQGYNSFTIEAKMNFASDNHPATELDNKEQKVEEVVMAAAAAKTKEDAAPAAALAAAKDAEIL